MDPVVSVVNLEDEYQGTSEERVRGQLDESLLSAGPEFDVTNLASGQSSGVCSSPPESTIPQSTAIGGNAQAIDTVQDEGDQLIRDVIHQLERHCSTSNDDLLMENREVAIEVGQVEGALPLAASLFTGIGSDRSSASSAAAAFEKSVSPMVGESERHKMVSGGSTSSAYSMWIASAKTRETLALLPPTGDGRICYTMPGTMVDESLGDPTADALRKYCGDDPNLLSPQRRAHRSSPGQVNIPSLLELVASGDFRAAVDLSGKWLKMHGQGIGKAHQPSRNTDESLKVWSLRVHLLVNIGQCNLAASELEAFGNLDAPDLYYEYYPETYRGRKGSMVPFSMRLLHAELPRLIGGQHQESLVRLNRIVAVIRQIIRNLNDEPQSDGAALELWRRRQRKAQHSLARSLLAVKDFRLAATLYDGLTDSDEALTRSLSGRVHLVLGNQNIAKAEFQKFQNLGDDARANSWVAMHSGYVNAFNNNFVDALNDFQRAAQYDPTNIYATNNAAVSLLYLGRLDEAVAMLEGVVQQNPVMALQESMCTNLCTLYELESARSTQKKIGMLKLVNQNKGDGFNVACLKLPG